MLQQDEHSTRERERQQPDASVLRIKWDDSLSRPPTTTPLANDTTQDWMSQFWSDVPTTTTLDSDLDRDLDQEFLRSIDHDPPRSDDKDDDEFAQLVVHIIEANRNNSDTNSPPPSTRPPTESVRIDKEGEQQREHAVANNNNNNRKRHNDETTATTFATSKARFECCRSALELCPLCPAAHSRPTHSSSFFHHPKFFNTIRNRR